MKKILIVCMLISGLLTGCKGETITSESYPAQIHNIYDIIITEKNK